MRSNRLVLQSESQEKVSQLEAALQDANKLLRGVESRIANGDAALQVSEEQLQASRDEGQDLRSRLGSVSSQLKAAEARLEEQTQSSKEAMQELKAQLGSIKHQLLASKGQVRELRVSIASCTHSILCFPEHSLQDCIPSHRPTVARRPALTAPDTLFSLMQRSGRKAGQTSWERKFRLLLKTNTQGQAHAS